MSKAENLASLLNASGLIDSDDLANGSISSAKLADGSVSSTKLADGSVTDLKYGGEISVDGGNVGIGTTTPNFQLDLEGASNSTYLRIGGDDTNNDRGLKFTSSASASFNGAIHTINAPSSQGEIAFATNSTEVLRINSSGIVSSGNITASSGSITDTRGSVREFGDGIFTNDTNYTIPSGSSGQCIRLGSGVSTITVDANNLADGEIITIINQNNITPRIDFINCSLGARVGGVNSNYNGVTGPTIQAYGVCTIIAPVQTRVFITGNLTV